jgi:hypothetical protein
MIWLALPAGATSERADCGVERWTVKTLQDRPALLPVQTTTIASLIARPKPSPLPGNRAPFERHQFRVTVQVVRLHNEEDGDIHAVLQDAAGNTMIAEPPMASCNTGATPYRRQQKAQARAAVKVCGTAQVTGVASFDFDHGQTGVAPNAIELHPILGFRCLTGGGAKGPPTTSPTRPTAPAGPSGERESGEGQAGLPDVSRKRRLRCDARRGRPDRHNLLDRGDVQVWALRGGLPATLERRPYRLDVDGRYAHNTGPMADRCLLRDRRIPPHFIRRHMTLSEPARAQS